MIAHFRHRPQLEALSRFLALEIDGLVAAINTPPLHFNGQLVFPAVRNPSTDPNTQDDYRVRKAWIPIDSSGAGLIFAAAVGEYSRIGARVDFTGQVTYPATASGAAAKIGGLPFLASAFNTAVAIGFQTGGVAGLQARVQASTATVVWSVEITSAAVTNAQLTGAILVFSGSYLAAT